jgi:hypothetical protein
LANEITIILFACCEALVNEIAIIDHSISDDDQTLSILNELGRGFKEITAPIHGRETSLAS